MATFHVYIEGPVASSPDAIGQLAKSISENFGLPAADLVTRLGRGRFRVKANVDRVTADTYAKALADVGARVTVEEAHPTQPIPVSRAANPPAAPPVSTAPQVASRAASPVSVPPQVASRAASPVSAVAPVTSAVPVPSARGSSSLPPPAVERPSSSSLPPATAASSKAAPLQSGLSAAFSGEMPAANLGALDSLSLASLDGNDAGGFDSNAFDSNAFAPAPAPLPSLPTKKVAPAPVRTAPAAPVAKPAVMKAVAPAKATKPADVPLDLFAPPEEGAGLDVDLADDEPEPPAHEPSAVPRTKHAPAPATGSSAQRPMPSSEPAAPRASAADGTPRGRFALGMFLALLLGFVPTHLVASWRERSAFQAIDEQVAATQLRADTPELYGALDSFREAQLGRKASEQRNIAMIAMLIWAAAGVGLGFVWFRTIPWDRRST